MNIHQFHNMPAPPNNLCGSHAQTRKQKNNLGLGQDQPHHWLTVRLQFSFKWSFLDLTCDSAAPQLIPGAAAAALLLIQHYSEIIPDKVFMILQWKKTQMSTKKTSYKRNSLDYCYVSLTFIFSCAHIWKEMYIIIFYFLHLFDLKKLELNSSFILWKKAYKWKLLEAGLRTAAVLVKIMQRVETRLLLLVCLERVAGLQIGVLHDPAGPKGKEGRRKACIRTTKQNYTPTSYELLYLGFCFKTNPKTKTDSSFSRHTQIFSDRLADLWLLTLYPKIKV